MIYLTLFWEFMKIGAFTFGGGYAMIPLIEKEIVNKYQWLTMKQFTDLIAIAEMTPGPMAVNSATLVGYKVAKFWGAVVSTVGVVLPSFLVIWAIASVFSQFQNNPTVQAAFRGLRPAVLGLIIVAAISISKTSILSEYKSILIVIGTVIALTIFKIHPILVLIISAITGIVFLR
jgi:chromate transporter